MSLALTTHAVDQFHRRWRPTVTREAARRELEALVAQAAPTKRQTVPGDARLYIALSEVGERIELAVRGLAVLTVLPPRYEDDEGPDEELVAESQATRAACRKLLAEGTQQSTAEAEAILRAWKEGKYVTPLSVKHAHKTLGMPFTPTYGWKAKLKQLQKP